MRREFLLASILLLALGAELSLGAEEVKRPQSVVVLPFKNLNPDGPEDDGWDTRIAQTVTSLSTAPGTPVRAGGAAGSA